MPAGCLSVYLQDVCLLSVCLSVCRQGWHGMVSTGNQAEMDRRVDRWIEIIRGEEERRERNKKKERIIIEKNNNNRQLPPSRQQHQKTPALPVPYRTTHSTYQSVTVPYRTVRTIPHVFLISCIIPLLLSSSSFLSFSFPCQQLLPLPPFVRYVSPSSLESLLIAYQHPLESSPLPLPSFGPAESPFSTNKLPSQRLHNHRPPLHLPARDSVCRTPFEYAASVCWFKTELLGNRRLPKIPSAPLALSIDSLAFDSQLCWAGHGYHHHPEQKEFCRRRCRRCCRSSAPAAIYPLPLVPQDETRAWSRTC